MNERFTQLGCTVFLQASVLIALLVHDPALGQEATESEQALPEEVTVVGQPSLQSMRIAMDRAEDDMYDIFNELNEDDRYDVHCSMMRFTGSLLHERVCMANYLREQYGESASRSFFDTPNDPRPAILNSRRAFADKLVELAGVSPKFRDAVQKFELSRRAFIAASEDAGSE